MIPIKISPMVKEDPMEEQFDSSVPPRHSMVPSHAVAIVNNFGYIVLLQTKLAYSFTRFLSKYMSLHIVKSSSSANSQ